MSKGSKQSKKSSPVREYPHTNVPMNMFYSMPQMPFSQDPRFMQGRHMSVNPMTSKTM